MPIPLNRLQISQFLAQLVSRRMKVSLDRSDSTVELEIVQPELGLLFRPDATTT